MTLTPRFRSTDDETRYIEGRLTDRESYRALAWDQKRMQLQCALDAGLIDAFEIEPLDLASDEIVFSVRHKPQIEQH